MAEDVVISIGVETREFLAAMSQIRGETDNLKGKMESAAISGAAIGTLISQAITGSIGYIKQAVAETAAWANTMSSMSATLGVSVEKIQLLSVSAKLAGESVGKLEIAFTALSSKVIAAREGSKAALDDFARLKLDPRTFKDSEDALDQVLEKLGQMAPGMERTQAAAEIFGRRLGASMLQIADEQERARKVMEDFHLMLSGPQVDALEEFRKQLVIVELSTEALRKHIALALTPAMQELIQEFLNFKSEGDVREYAEQVARGFQNIAGVAILVVAGVKNLGQAFGELVGFAVGVWNALDKIGDKLIDVFTGRNKIKGNPIAPLLDALKAGSDEMDKNWAQATERAGKFFNNDLPKIATEGGKKAAAGFGAGLGASGGNDKLVEQLKKMSEALSEQLVAMEGGEEAAIRYKLTHGELGKAVGATADAHRVGIIAMVDYITAAKRLAEQMEAVRAAERVAIANEERIRDAQNAFTASMFKQAETVALAVDPMAAYSKEVERLMLLWEKFGLSDENFTKAMKKATDTYSKATDSMDEDTKLLINAIVGGLDNAFKDLGKSTFSLGTFLQRLESQLLDIGTKILILNPLATEMARIFKDLGSSGGGGGGIGSIFSGIASKFGFGGGAAAGGAPAVSGLIDMVPAMFMHGGGLVGAPAPMRLMPAGMFDNAVRLHSGLKNDEFPAVLQRGEQVIPRHGGSARNSGGNVTVNVNVPQGIDKLSATRIATEAGMATQRALRRNT